MIFYVVMLSRWCTRTIAHLQDLRLQVRGITIICGLMEER